MKIAYIVLKGIPFCGGIERYTEELGARLAAKGHEVILYVMRHYGTEDGIYRGMRVRTIPSIKIRSLEKMSAAFMGHFIQCLEPGIDVIHSHAFGPSLFCFIPRLMRRKIVGQGHGLEWKRSRWSRWGRLVLKLTEAPSVRFPHVLTVVSRVQQAYVKDKYGVDSLYIPTGVNIPVYEQPDLIKKYGLQGNDYILFAARLVREKGAHYLIKAYNRLSTNLKLVIAGDAQHEARYQEELRQLVNGNKKIIFTGFASGKMLCELFSNPYLFVLPSEVEGLPTALLEAMSYGNCCLVSNVPENAEALNKHGYLFNSQDVIDLAERLQFLIDNPCNVVAVKDGARKYALENFSWDIIASRFEELYHSLLQ
jgi:glycosyltransferase involved in cell wall biosynthesis